MVDGTTRARQFDVTHGSPRAPNQPPQGDGSTRSCEQSYGLKVLRPPKPLDGDCDRSLMLHPGSTSSQLARRSPLD